MDNKDVLTSLSLIQKDFQLAPNHWDVVEGIDPEKAFTLLYKLVEHLLLHDFNQLINSLYRIDVSEEKLKAALAISPNPAQTISEMIWERELQKVDTRKKYSAQ
ncbi:MAG: hypothetical protein ACJAXX_001229 [Roseivirga sp.]|jgi:hypothetical protein